MKPSNIKAALHGAVRQVSKKRNAHKSKNKREKKRLSLDARLSKLSPEERTLRLLYGSHDPDDPVEQLAERARALRVISKALGPVARQSEAYQNSLNELKERVAEPLLKDEAGFFRRLSKVMLRLRKTEPKGSAVTREIRLILQHELKAGQINLTQFSARLKKYRGIHISVRHLRRLVPKYKAAPSS